MKVKVNDYVRLLDYPDNHINARARVDVIYEDGSLRVSNLNMPFQGTLCYDRIEPNKWILLSGRK